jgi:hypothetical protein
MARAAARHTHDCVRGVGPPQQRHSGQRSTTHRVTPTPHTAHPSVNTEPRVSPGTPAQARHSPAPPDRERSGQRDRERRHVYRIVLFCSVLEFGPVARSRHPPAPWRLCCKALRVCAYGFSGGARPPSPGTPAGNTMATRNSYSYTAYRLPAGGGTRCVVLFCSVLGFGPVHRAGPVSRHRPHTLVSSFKSV